MLAPVTAIAFHKPMGVGKTAPSLLTCAHEDGSTVEMIVKFASGCEGGIGALLREAIAAMLAADLDLPVPEPFLVQVDSAFAAAIPETDGRYREAKQHALASVGWNFGSKRLPSGFATIAKDRPLPQALVPMAADILAFDTFLANPDRTVENPNCQSNGRELAIFDHELTFRTAGLIGWKPPWKRGGIQFPKGLPARQRHVFLEQLRGEPLDFSRLAGAFEIVSPARLKEYRDALPSEWVKDGNAVGEILEYITALRDNIDSAIKQLVGALQ